MSGSSLISNDPETVALQRRRRLAEQLLAGSMDTSNVRAGAPWSVIGKLAQALAGGYSNWQVGQDEKALNNERQAGRQEFWARGFDADIATPASTSATTPAPPEPSLPVVPPQSDPPVSERLSEMLRQPSAAAPPNVYGRNQGLLAQRDAMLEAPPQQLADASAARAVSVGQPLMNPARPGPAAPVPGWDSGLAPPTGIINAGIGGTPLASQLQPAAPAAGSPIGSSQRMAATLLQGLRSSNPLVRQDATLMLPFIQQQVQREDQQQFQRQNQLENREDRAAMRALQERQLAASEAARAASQGFQARGLDLQERSLTASEAARAETRRLQEAAQLQQGLPQGYRFNPASGAAERVPGLPEPTPQGVPPGYRPTPEGGLAPIPGGPADPATVAAAAAARQPPEGRPLADSSINRLSTLAGVANEWSGLNDTFRDDYGGYRVGALGNAANAVTRNMGGSPEAQAQADWWQRYNLQANQVRNELFGSALTAPEKAAFDAAMISPGMTPQQIRMNLTRQTEIARQGVQRQGSAMIANGSNRRTVEALLGFGIPDPSAAASPSAPPAGGGWSIRPVQ